MNLSQLSNIAIKAALSAGKVIQKYINEDIAVEKKKTGTSYASQVVTLVDIECETAILSHLLPTCEEFSLALLSEETEDDCSRFEEDFFWCIDPMDGTLAFINKRPGFSVSIALIAKDGTPYIGIVFDPSTETLYHAIKGNGAFKNGIPWKIKNTNNHLTYVTDRKLKDTPRADEIEKLLNKNVAKLGLSGVKEIAGAGSVLNGIFVLENGPACMLKFPKKENGGGSIWDFAATVCIYKELGLPATNFEGGKLDLNRQEGTFMNHEGIFYSNLIDSTSKNLDDAAPFLSGKSS
jgi:fructose-1,6-bisphosphatase/inositol monophosphatase family enzyme